MTGILLVRKIILWFFIIISPVFPLLLFYKPIRNTAKIWIGEFFRWLLYAPLFAIFLHGLVVVWQKGIPLYFPQIAQGLPQAGEVVYPTAINILLGGPGQAISMTNSVNLSNTFALYVVALLMLWVVILLPFLLLKIFLDYLATLSLDGNVLFKQFANRGTAFSQVSPVHSRHLLNPRDNFRGQGLPVRSHSSQGELPVYLYNFKLQHRGLLGKAQTLCSALTFQFQECVILPNMKAP